MFVMLSCNVNTPRSPCDDEAVNDRLTFFTVSCTAAVFHVAVQKSVHTVT